MKKQATLPGRWGAWASRIGGRFGRADTSLPMATRLYARSARTAVLVEQRLSTIVNWQPYFQIVVAPWSSRERIILPTRHSNPARLEFLTRARELVTRRETLKVFSQTQAFLRIVGSSRMESVARMERRFLEQSLIRRRESETVVMARRLVDRVARPADRVEQRALMTTGDPRMTLRRDAAGAPAVRIDRPAEKQVHRTAETAPNAPVMPAINVDALADQVIRQIDRRVVARRERMGRI